MWSVLLKLLIYSINNSVSGTVLSIIEGGKKFPALKFKCHENND